MSMARVRYLLCAALTIGPCKLVAQAAQPDSPAASVLQGVYTESQAERGQRTFAQTCASCHTAGEFGRAFMTRWSGATVVALFSDLRVSMPYDTPGSLRAQQYADIVSFFFRTNGIPSGAAELPADTAALRKLRIELAP